MAGRRRKAVGIIVTAALVFISPGIASASGGGDGCDPGRVANSSGWSYGGGLTNSGSSYGGVEGFIENYSPYVPSGSGNEAAQWVMLTNKNNGDQYAQIGWIEYPNSIRHTIVQFSWGPGGDYWTNKFAPYAINSAIQYKVLYNPACTSGECFTFYADGTYKTYSGYNWTPTNWRAFSETHNVATQFPGGYANPSTTATIERYAPAGATGSWGNASGVVSLNTSSPTGTLTSSLPGWDNISQQSSNSYESWDGACAY